jgi:hypothetical protein
MMNDSGGQPDRSVLEARVRDYVRAGWSVIHQTGVKAELKKGEQITQLSFDSQGQLVTEGHPLPTFFLDGRSKAWLVLLVVIILTYAVAYLLGWLG